MLSLLLHTSNLLNFITPTSVGVFVCLVERKSIDSILAENTLYKKNEGSTHRYITALRQTLRQYIELCLIARTLTQLGLQVPIKTIRQ